MRPDLIRLASVTINPVVVYRLPQRWHVDGNAVLATRAGPIRLPALVLARAAD